MNLSKNGTSGWFDELPAHWPAIPIKHGFGLIGSGATPPTGEARYYDGTIPWVNTSELREAIVVSTEKTLTTEALEEFTTLKTYPKGTLLFAMYGATIGRVALLGIPATVNQAVCALAEPNRFDPRFAFYGLQASREFLAASSSGGGQPNLNAEKVRDHKLPCPDLKTQRAVADYLDRETARLDALVVAKERVLGLLAEKRLALITRAVTRGLDHRAPLRDSGIPWLGEIPAHWEVLPLKYGFSRIGSGTTPPTGSTNYYDGDVPWVTTSELRENVVTSTNELVTQEALADLSSLRTYPTGSLLFAMYGATIGRIAVLGVEATVNQAVCVLADPTRFETWFTFFSLQASREHLIVQASGAGQPNLNAEIVRNHRIACPPLQEQNAINEGIVTQSGKIDALRSATERTIALLKERRAALIAAAVTGHLGIPEAAA